MFYTAAVLGGLKHKHLETSSLFETHVFLSFPFCLRLMSGQQTIYNNSNTNSSSVTLASAFVGVFRGSI